MVWFRTVGSDQAETLRHMERTGSGRSTPRFALIVERGEGATTVVAVAAAIASTWSAIDDALSPIIGKRGMSALYQRSVYVTSSAHPALASLRAEAQAAMDLEALTSALAQLDLAGAAMTGDALLQTFADLLASLVGPGLAERLLTPVLSHLPAGTPVQDSEP